MSGRAMKTVEYKCGKCGSTDTPRYYLDEAPAPALNCWKCHAGLNKPIEAMFERGEGMFPTGPAVNEAVELTN